MTRVIIMIGEQMTCLAIHDISCLGKCSLTAALPILSAAGVSVGILPTALLSNQTGGLNLYTRLDLTEEMGRITDVWSRTGARFDAAFSGYLGSARQAALVRDAVDRFVVENGLFLCDPAMADNGALYSGFDADFVPAMRSLCARADVLTPNVTEAMLLLGKDADAPFDESVLYALRERFELAGCVVTGVSDGDQIGSACLDAGGVSYAMTPRLAGMFHSTGDVFASALTGCLLRGLPLAESCRAASRFTYRCIVETVENGGDSRYGLCFEPCLGTLIEELEEKQIG